MREMKIFQILFGCSSIITTALCIGIPFHIVPAHYGALYVAFVLIPQVLTIILQLYAVKKSLKEYIKAVEELKNFKYDRKKKYRKFRIVLIDTIYSFAELKSAGINPNRAGPFKVFA